MDQIIILKLSFIMKRNNNLLINLVVWLIKNLWKKRLGVYYDKKYKIICRFYPTCAEYAILALNKYGLIKGFRLTTARVRRCTTDNTESCYDYP